MLLYYFIFISLRLSTKEQNHLYIWLTVLCLNGGGWFALVYWSASLNIENMSLYCRAQYVVFEITVFNPIPIHTIPSFYGNC